MQEDEIALRDSKENSTEFVGDAAKKTDQNVENELSNDNIAIEHHLESGRVVTDRDQRGVFGLRTVHRRPARSTSRQTSTSKTEATLDYIQEPKEDVVGEIASQNKCNLSVKSRISTEEDITRNSHIIANGGQRFRIENNKLNDDQVVFQNSSSGVRNEEFKPTSSSDINNTNNPNESISNVNLQINTTLSELLSGEEKSKQPRSEYCNDAHAVKSEQGNFDSKCLIGQSRLEPVDSVVYTSVITPG